MNLKENDLMLEKGFTNQSTTAFGVQTGASVDTEFPNVTMNAITLMQPTKLTFSAWLEHIPFAFWLISAHRPNVVVELGTHFGSSYFAFCQAIEQLRLPTRSYAIDLWKGDEHAGFYGENVYTSVRDYNARFYSRFSTLMRTTFEEGVNFFKNGEIDLLHIDGYHTYEAVKKDFEDWLPKLSRRGVVVLHDSNERRNNFGVFQFVEELRQTYPCFEFAHGHGLTIVGVGPDQTSSMIQLFEADKDESEIRNIQEVFSRLGKACFNEYTVESLKNTVSTLRGERDRSVKEVEQLRLKIKETEANTSKQTEQFYARLKAADALDKNLLQTIQQLELSRQEIELLRKEAIRAGDSMAKVTQELAIKEEHIRSLLNSTSWIITKPIRAIKRLLRFIKRAVRSLVFRSTGGHMTSNSAHTSSVPEADFDREWYLQTYPDVAASGVDPTEHYLTYGKAEERYPSREEFQKIGFDREWYLQAYPDVAASGVDPTEHFLAYGKAEQRYPSREAFLQVGFDHEWYLQAYPDVATSGIDPTEHYLVHGRVEGRYPTQQALIQTEAPDFDAEWYLENNSDVMKAQLSPLHHYIAHGRNEGRYPSLSRMVAQDLDKIWYLNTYPDVAASGMDPFEHFILYGYPEGRQPSATPRLSQIPFFRYGHPEHGGRGKPLLFESPVELNENFSCSIGVHLHLYYMDLADEFIKHLNNIPTNFDLFISIPHGKYNIDDCENLFKAGLKLLGKLVIRETENKGRDVYPFIVEFGQELLAYDFILHAHSKKSPQSQTKGWRRFLLHYTLGSRSITTQILNALDNDPKLGAIFPAYFHGVTRQPNWGANRQIVLDQISRLGLTLDMNHCPDYPAGSFFWAKSEALRPLLDGAFTIDDFDSEQGQHDGTLAHGIERLFGIIPRLQNYTTTIRFVDRDYRLVNYVDQARVVASAGGSISQLEQDRQADIATYQRAVRERGDRKPRIACVTAIIGPFDALLLPNLLESEVDYYCFSDTISDGYGVFNIYSPPYIDADPRRSARYIKTNLLKYIKNYDYVVWIDANVELKVSLSNLVQRVASSGRQLGAIIHPVRETYLEEAEEIKALKIDDPALVNEQIKRYASIDDLCTVPLIESNVLVLDAREEAVHNFMRLWWNEINTYSRRDQLSINYALYTARVSWHALLEDLQSTRDSDDFALYGHGLNQWGPKPNIYAAWHTYAPQQVRDIAIVAADEELYSKDQQNLDVVVCVHNALEDVRACLASLSEALQGRGNIILVDDASDAETKNFLAEYAVENGAKLIRQDNRLGYTKSANNGVRSGVNRNVLLLNSDTIVPPESLNKLSYALDSQPNLGVVGPLSNAASTQSVPSIKGTATQTAINTLPSGLSPTDVDQYFEARWDRQLVRVPLVHGFCFAVKREVFESVGLFDEESFPHGYGEENDFCFRVADAGFDLAILTNTYIYHAKSKSYKSEERTKLMDEGMKALIRKYTTQRIQRSVSTMDIQPKLEEAREQAQKLYDEYSAERRV